MLHYALLLLYERFMVQYGFGAPEAYLIWYKLCKGFVNLWSSRRNLIVFMCDHCSKTV